VVTAIAVRPHEPMFATGGDDHHVYLWDTHEGCVLERLEGHRDWILSLAFSPDGNLLASAANDGRVIFWNVAERRAVHEFADARHVITQVVWSHDGRWIAGVGFEDCLRIYDFESKQLARVLKCPDRDIRTLAVSPDDKLLAAGGRNGVIRFWRLPEGSHVLDIRPHHRRIRALNFSPDGAYLVSAGEDRWLHVHPVDGDETGFDLPTPPTKTLCATFYGPQHLATGGSDNLIHLWDIAAGRRLGALAGHTGSVAALDTTSSLLVSGSFDTTVRLWTIVPNLAKKSPAQSRESTRR
jgi:WD40 repeat protein